MSNKQHWEQTYTERTPDDLGWYTPHLAQSLAWIEALGLPPETPIIDIGGGASTLVDDLLAAGHQDLTVLDLSAQALAVAQARLGERADAVTWRIGDITDIALPAGHYALWHDRAALHFLTEPAQRARYAAQLRHALRADGEVIIGVFALEAPPQCANLPVHRYDIEALGALLGEGFALQRHIKQMHHTPRGKEQMYLYAHFRRSR
ncbi:class I SAM-dependent methyltransferase [Ectothiorhodospiraceae bacterium 2226]|nr:class I SAM-dependent methyltransferase [Ectothiorhodospiraceae bacterium 2226]